MDELYKMMKDKLRELYESEDGCIVLEFQQFFPLYKLVCDMMQIRAIVKQSEE